MVILGIMMFVMLVMWGSLAAAYGLLPPENGRYLLGITLPVQYREEPQVLEVLASYKKKCKRITWWGFVGCFLVIPLNGYISFLLLFIMGWFAFLYHLYNENIRIHARRLYDVKCKNSWFSGSTHPVSCGSGEAYGDDDEYWLYGAPGRKSTGKMEANRLGIGLTTNNTLIPTVGEKAVWVVMFLFVGGIALFMMPFDFARITMEMDGTSCRVQGASMGYTINLEDVKEVTLLEERPDMSKKSGFDSNRFYLGDFRVKDYGTCKVYINLKNDSVIKVDAGDRLVWFNGATKEQTKEYYEQLKEAVALAGTERNE